MLSKKFLGIVISTITSVGIMAYTGSFVFAEESQDAVKKETHKDSEKAMAPEHPNPEMPTCPTCKEVRVSPSKGKTIATMVMVCPNCKNEITEFTLHHCDKCGKDVLSCIMCKTAAAEYLPVKYEGTCPKCKEVRTSPIKGRILARTTTKCLGCKKKTQEWAIQYCETCKINFIGCPNCQGKHKKSAKGAAKKESTEAPKNE